MTQVFKKTLVVDTMTPVGAYAVLRRRPGASFLLESVVAGERWGRYSILGYRPKSRVALYGEEGVDPFAKLAELLPVSGSDVTDVATRFVKAHVGMITYDTVHYATKVPVWPDGSKEPIVRLVGDSTVVVFDNLTHLATIASTSEDAVHEAVEDLKSVVPLAPLEEPSATLQPADVDVNMSDEEYMQCVERCREYIRAGDAFQIVPARTFSTPAHDADIFDVYRALRVLSPAPYMFILEFDGKDGVSPVAIAGASPETLARVQDGNVFLRPIAGTRRRGRSQAEDEELALEMINDPKELAEHVMLIDLARNDVGRVAATDSVGVPVRMQVDRFSHVMHIVSEVQGKLRDGLGPWDVLRATFPAGTLSGAPKVRAMQIIRELEKKSRFAYGGAIGYITSGTDLDFAIAIRTVVMTNGRFEVTAGAGIVADSVPALEAKETSNKARAALAAIEAARRARR